MPQLDMGPISLSFFWIVYILLLIFFTISFKKTIYTLLTRRWLVNWYFWASKVHQKEQKIYNRTLKIIYSS